MLCRVRKELMDIQQYKTRIFAYLPFTHVQQDRQFLRTRWQLRKEMN